MHTKYIILCSSLCGKHRDLALPVYPLGSMPSVGLHDNGRDVHLVHRHWLDTAQQTKE